VVRHGGLCLILAHPDDEAFFAVGMIAQARRANRRVELILATAGEAGTPAPGTAPTKQALARVRRREMRQVAALLGIHRIHWLGLADRHVAEFTPGQVRRAARALCVQQPEVVFTFAPDGHNGHPDHIGIHAFAAEALALAEQLSGSSPGSALVPPSVLWTTGVPPWNAHDGAALMARNDVDYLLELGEDRRLKDRALRMHRSQQHHIGRRFFGATDSELPAEFEVFRHGGGPRLTDPHPFLSLMRPSGSAPGGAEASVGHDSPWPANGISL